MPSIPEGYLFYPANECFMRYDPQTGDWNAVPPDTDFHADWYPRRNEFEWYVPPVGPALSRDDGESLTFSAISSSFRVTYSSKDPLELRIAGTGPAATRAAFRKELKKLIRILERTAHTVEAAEQ